MKTRTTGVSVAVLLAVALAAGQDAANLSNTTSEGRLAPLLANLGNLNAPITTKAPDAQKYFNQGLTLVYGFNHAEALRSFREVARIDPNCAIAYWGQALALAPNINDPAIGPDREQQGYQAIQEAVKRKQYASKKEAALIDALAARFSAKPPEGNRDALNEAYAKAMTSVYKRFSRDPDVAVLYADAVMNTRPWNYWSTESNPYPGIADVRRALEDAIRRHPDHPGALHMYVHLMEASDEVDVATPSADRLGPLVPAAGHLVHMPAHIYIRTGRYQDAAAANIKAIAADESYITQCRAQGIYPAAYYPHNIHFLNAVLAMDGQSAEAMKSARSLASKHDHAALQDPIFAFAHLLKTIPAMTMVRFGLWDEMLKEPEPPEDQPFGLAMYHFARGFAFSAQAKTDEARNELDLLRKAAQDKWVKEQKILGQNAFSQLADIAIAMLEGDIAGKAGEHDKAVESFTRAVKLEDALTYDEPPDWALPPRPYLGAAYLKAGKPAEAEKVFREDLKRHRNNGWSLFGLEQSLLQQGKAAEADRAKADFDKAWARADVKLTASRF